MRAKLFKNFNLSDKNFKTLIRMSRFRSAGSRRDSGVKNLFLGGILILISLIFSTSKAEAAITKEINYQGRMTNLSDVNVPDTSYNIVFRIYDAASGGTCLWSARGTCGTPTARSVTTSGGIFSIGLGDTVAGDNAINLEWDTTYYLSVKVGADSEMSPRKKISAGGYAFNANNLIGDGRIGIGNTSPSNDALNISYNPTSGAFDAADITYGVGGGTGNALQVTQLGSGNAFLVNDETNDTSPFIIKNDGNVGIGTTNPTALLDIVSAATTTNVTAITATALTSGYAKVINVNGAAVLTTGGAISIVGPTSTAAQAAGSLLKIATAGAVTGTDGSGNSFQISSGTLTGTVASISDAGVMTTTGDLLTLTAGAATTPTGLLTISAAGLTSGYAQNINVNGAAVLTTGGAINIVGPTSTAAQAAGSLLKIATTGAVTGTDGSGNSFQISSGTLTGTVASISDAGVMTTTGDLLTLTAGAATTPTGLLTISAAGLTSGYAQNINVNGAAVLTTGGAINIVGPTSTAAQAAGSLLKIATTGAVTGTDGSGNSLQISSGTLTGTVASITDAGVMTTTGDLLTLTANAATTPTGLLTISAAGLTSGYAQNINVNGAAVLTTGGAINIVGPTSTAAQAAGSLLKIATTGAVTGTDGSGNSFQISSGTLTGTVASITGTGVMTTTGDLLSLIANSATTPTGLLTITANGLTTGIAQYISSTSTALTTGGLFSLYANGAPAGSWTGNLAKIEYNNASVNVDGTALKIGLLGAAAGDGTALNITTEQTGTNGFALRVNDDGTYTDTTPFVVDETGNVGVGTTAPGYTFQVIGSANVSHTLNVGGSSASVLQIADRGTFTNNYQLYSSSDIFRIWNATYGSDILALNTSGNVGIGTTNPGYKLDVAGSINATSYYVGGSLMGSVAAGTLTGQTLYWNGSAWTANATLFNNNTNVGIGTTNPLFKLVVAGGSVNKNSIGFRSGVLTPTGTDYSSGRISSGFIAETGYDNAYLDLEYTTAADTYVTGLRLINGNVGIGTTSPGYALDVNGSIRADDTIYAAGIAMGGMNGIYFSGSTNYANISGGDSFLTFGTDGSTRMHINSTGNVGIGNTSPNYKLDVSRVGINTPAGYGADLNIGNLVINYPGNSGWATTWNSNILLSGEDSTSISFQDSGARVDTFRVAAGQFNIGENVGWGLANTRMYGNAYIDGNVGIGTTNPTALLDIVSAATTTNVTAITATALTSGYAKVINVNGAAVLTTGGAISIVGPTSTAAQAAGSLLKIATTGAVTGTDGSGNSFQISSGTLTGTVASITDAGVMTTTGDLLTLTANAATTPTGLLTINSQGLTSGYAQNINVNGAAVLTTGGAISIVGPTSTAAQAAGSLLKIATTGAVTGTDGSGNSLQISSGTLTGTVASISDAGVMTTTGDLLTLTAGAATTPTGLLTISAAGLTSGYAQNINVNGAAVLTTGGAINIVGPTSTAAQAAGSLLKIATAGAVTGTDGSGNSLQVSSATVTGTIASITGTAAMTTTGDLLSLIANSATTPTGLLTITANGLTTGTAQYISSTSTALTTGGLFSVYANGAPAGSWTGNLAKIEYNNASVNVDGTALKIGLLGAAAGDGTALNITTEQTGTNGFALRVNDDGTYTDTTPFVVDETGNVGIGTTSPGYKLDVAGSINATSYYISGSLMGSVVAGSITGQTLYWNGSSWTANVNLFNNNTNVGIGTTAPGYALHLSSGQANTSTTAVAMAMFGSNEGGVNSDGLKFLMMGAATQANRVSALQTGDGSTNNGIISLQAWGGNVGIGTTSPTLKLDIASAGLAAPANSGTTNAGLMRVGYNDRTWAGAELNMGIINASPYPVWLQAQMPTDLSVSRPLSLNPNGGNVGIGTTNPGTKLDVYSITSDGANIRSFNNVSSGYGSLEIIADTTARGVLRTYGSAVANTVFGITLANYTGIFSDGAASNGLMIGTAVAKPVIFGTNNVEAMRIISGGNVGIGTTAPSSLLDVAGVGSIVNIRDSQTASYGNGVSGGIINFNSKWWSGGTTSYATSSISSAHDGVDGLMSTRLMFSTSHYATGVTTEVMRINNVGNVGIGTTNPTQKLQIGVFTSGGVSTATPDAITLGSTYSNTPGSNLKMRVYDDGTSVSGLGISSNQFDIATWATGNIAFYRGATQTMIIDGTGNVGIGTTAPVQRLAVISDNPGAGAGYAGAAILSGAAGSYTSLAVGRTTPELYFGISGGAHYLTDAVAGSGVILHTGKLLFGSVVGAASQVTFDTTGNVGIGTTSPGAILDVAGSIKLAGSSSTASYSFKYFDTGGEEWYTQYAYGGLNFGETGQADGRLFLKDGGNVGIGTTSPEGHLDIMDSGSESANYSSLPSGKIASIVRTRSFSAENVIGVYGQSLIQNAGGNSYGGYFVGTYGSLKNKAIGIYAEGADYAAIFGSGNVGIGTTNPLNKLEVAGDIKATGDIYASDGSAAYPSFAFNSSYTSGMYSPLSNTIGFSINGAEKVRINSSGNIGIGTTAPSSALQVVGNIKANFTASTFSYASVSATTAGTISYYSSDRRLKTNIDYIDSAIDVVRQLKPANYNLIADGSYTSGFIAQDTLGLVPGAANLMPDGYYSFNINGVVAYTTKAVQELDSRTRFLENRFVSSAAPAMLVNELGNIGIGTTNPTEKLTVAGNINLLGGSFIDDGVDISALILGLQNSFGAKELEMQKLSAELSALKLDSADKDLVAEQKIDALQNNLNFGGSQINLLGEKLSAVSQKLSQNFQAELELPFYQFASAGSELSFTLTDGAVSDGQFAGTYSSPENFQELALNLESTNQVDLSDKDLTQSYLVYDVFIEDPNSIEDYHTEIGNTQDTKEIEWNKSAHPFFLAGWNEVKLSLNEGVKSGEIDWETLGYFRAYFKFRSTTGLKFKNIRIETKAAYQPLAQTFGTENLDLWNNADQGTALKDIFATLDTQNQTNFNQEVLNTKLTKDLLAMQGQLDLLQSQSQAVIDLALALDTDNLVYKDESGSVLGLSIVQAEEVEAVTVQAQNYVVSEKGDPLKNNVGSVIIKIGEQEVLVANEDVTIDSKIIVTPVGSSPVFWVISEKINGVGFKIKLDKPAEFDIAFDYWVIRVEK